MTDKERKTLQACADYHRARTDEHDRLSGDAFRDREHHAARSQRHESWRAAIETAIRELVEGI